jgi:hypothetical protein
MGEQKLERYGDEILATLDASEQLNGPGHEPRPPA